MYLHICIHVTTTAIKILSMSITPKSSRVPFCSQFPSPPDNVECDFNHHHYSFICSKTSYTWCLHHARYALLSLSIMFLRFIPDMYIRSSLLFVAVFHCMNARQFG